MMRPGEGRREALAAMALGLAFAATAGCDVTEEEPSMAALTETGVSRSLATWRAERVDSVRYDLAFRLPRERAAPIRGLARIRFLSTGESGPVILDFAAPDSAVISVESRGEAVAHSLEDGHLVVPGDAVTDPEGRASLDIEFVAGDAPLNRNDEYLYTLFVPARAREAFPCFDQPDLKARFRLTLDAPDDWRAVSNTPRRGPAGATEDSVAAPEPFGSPGEDRRIHRFRWTAPLPTYLFSFAAGRFQVETARRDGRTIRMFHRETDAGKVERNRERVFDLHATAIRWLEEYTGIPLPFEKFDFVLVPSFQYGGMEHPGAVLYRASRVLLEEGATAGEELGRASLIAHETAHMWFGDLVTMRWFDDVWMKEVFANFTAAKIVHPSFPEIDHDLRFLLDHHPAAYAVDRSGGTHPIRQELQNLADAGVLYGAIIYQKAPIVMRQLEALVGEESFRQGVRDYLDGGRWGNAGWPELVAALDPHTSLDVARWSHAWVEEAGRPVIHADPTIAEGRLQGLRIRQRDPLGRGLRWPQRLQVAAGSPDSLELLPVRLEGDSVRVEGLSGGPVPDVILPGAGGLGYGRFELPEGWREALVEALTEIRRPLPRAAGWLLVHDAVLEGQVAPEAAVELALQLVRAEDEDLLAERLLADLTELWWRYLEPGQRRRLASRVEEELWRALAAAETASRRTALFRAYREMALTDGALGRLEAIWRDRDPPEGLPLAEEDYSELAQALAVRGVDGAEAILEAQAGRIENPDRQERFRWVMPALSPDPSVRDSFFRSLADPENRRHEPWVTEGLSWLHHPLRAGPSRRYVEPALELLREVQATGDIFFPTRWLDATFRGHSSPEVAETVRRFLDQRPDYPDFLEDKVLQAADPVFRAARIRAAGSG